MKKFFTFLFAVMATVSAFAYTAQIDGIYYNVYDGENPYAEVTCLYSTISNSTAYTGDVVIPSSIAYEEKTYPVTSIGSYAFCYCSSLISVNIPNSITSIGKSAFYECSSLTSITIPDKIMSIGNQAFYNCLGLTSVVFPKKIDNTSADIQLPLKSNAVYFVNTHQWTNIYVHAWGGTKAGTNWPGVEAIKADFTYQGYDVYYFNAQSGDYQYCIFNNGESGIDNQTDDLLWSGGQIYCNNTWVGASAKQYIGDEVFLGCSKLTSIIIPDGVTAIGRAAFMTCTSLTSISLPENILSIGSGAFWDCYNLLSIVIPNSVTFISNDAFRNCSSLTSVTIPNSVTSIGNSAFLDCSALTSIYVYGSYTTPASLGSDAFEYTNDAPIYVPYDLVYKYAWSSYSDRIQQNPLDKSAITEVTITAHPSKSALHQALGLDSLQKVVSLKINGSINSYDIMMLRNQMPNLWELDLSDADIVANAYEYADGYCSKDNTLTTQAFTGTGTRIAKLVLPKTLTTIEAGAINGYVCELTIQKGITAIPDNAFENCTRLEAVSLPESLETIGASAFRGAGLKELVLPANVHSIGSYAFTGGYEMWWGSYSYYPGSTSNSTSDWDLHCRYDGQLQKVVIPAHSRLTEIAEGTFARNKQLKTLSILGDSIAYIGWGAFVGCGMDTLVLPPNLTALSTLSFGYCDKLKYIAMPNSLTEIADNAFVGCQNLDNVQFPVKLNSIGHHAFADCTHLRNVDIPGLVTEIGDYAFKDCQVQSVYSYLFDPFTIGQNTFSPYANANATLYIPNVEDTEMKYLYDTQWSQFLSRVRMDKSFEYKDFYANGDVVIGDNDDPLNGDPNANLEPGSGLIVEEGENGQHLGTVTITGEPGDWASLIAGCNLHVDSLRLVIKVKKNCWHFHGFPFDIPLANLHADGKYVIYEYDGQTRAERDTTGWKRLPKEQKHLKRGHGYIFNFNASGSLVITIATPNFCNLLEKIMLFFYPAAKNNNKSWNYAANPFFAYYSLNDLNFTGPVTFWDAVNRTYRSYRPGDDDYYLSPYEGFFLQNEKDEEFELTFDKTKTKTKNQKEETQANGHRMSAKQSSDNSRAIINLTLSGEDCSDDTRVVINPAARLTYDLGMDAQKFFSTDNVPQIYSLDADQLPCAINERPIGDGVINLGLKLPAAGQYTIDATRMDQTLYLLDREKNTLHTFADGAYTFSAPAGTLPARFALVEHYEAPTGIDNTADGRIEQTATGLYIHGTADIQIYSMTGIELCNGTCSGAIELPTGVYTMVCNGQASKVVIK